MKNSGTQSPFMDSQNEDNNSNVNIYYSNLLLFFQYLSNQNNSKYENGGVKNKIPFEQLLLGVGPFILTTNIDIFNITFIDYNINIKGFSEFLVFIINNPLFNYNDYNIKQINLIFLEFIKSKFETQPNIDNLQGIVGWNLNKLYEIFHKYIDILDNNGLLILFDNPNLKIGDKKKFDFFSEILIKFHFFGEKNENIQSFFDNFLFKKWKNVPNQTMLINLLITNKEISENSVFSLNNYQGQKISKDIELKAYTSSKNHYLIDNWRNVKLVETLILVSEDFDNYTQVKVLFDWVIKNIPEIIIMSLLMIKIDYTKNSLMNDLIIEILSSILFDKNPRIKFINEIWKQNKDIVIYVLDNSWENYRELMNLSIIFDLANNVIKDSLLPLVHSKYHNFSIHLGLLASKRDYLHIEKWIKKNIDLYGDEFINSLLDYLKIYLIQPHFNSGLGLNETNKANILEKAQLSLESLSIVLNTLNSYTNTDENDSINMKISLDTKKKISEINKNIFNIYDEIQDQQINSKEIEEEISQLLRSMFEGKISIDNIINILILYKSSKDKRKIELFSCLIHQIIVEYHNFTKYPKDKLKLMAELFGKIINNKLLEGLIETLALTYIYESIKSRDEKLYYFGMNALCQIIGNISCWPKYAKMLLDMEQIKQNKNIYLMILKENEKIQKRYNSQNVEKQNGKVPNSISETKSSDLGFEDNGKSKKQNNINENVDKLKHKLSGTPKSFIFEETSINNNNIIINNVEDNDNNTLLEKVIYNAVSIIENNKQSDMLEKAADINKFLNNDEINIKIFSYIIVTSKIIQSKNILYYNELFTRINNPILNKYVLKYTIKYIQTLLKINSLYMEEKNFNILKNLGSWLGIITILKNRPILARDIDFRELITEAYVKGKLFTTIPFICKVFSFISKSKIFTFNNPWINSILCLLKEIYLLNSLNSTIKKEIQSFFELVKININSIKINIPYLKDVKHFERMNKNFDFQNRHIFNLNIDKKNLEKKVGALNDFINNLISMLYSDKNNLLIQNPYIFDVQIIKKINEISNKIIDVEKKNLEDKKDMIIFLTNLLYQSILDTLPKMMDIYFSRPLEAAMTIVNQDYFYEFDINKYKAALNNTIKSLLSSFSIIGFHDMLKRNIAVNLDFCIKSHNVSKEIILYIKEFPNSEYINIGLEEILKFITKEAESKLNSNEEFRAQLEIRKNINNFRMKNNINNNEVRVRNKLPDKIRPNKEGLNSNEIKIYEKFQENNTVLKMYEEDRKISSFLNKICSILKEVMDKTWDGNTSIKISKYKNYESCMKKIFDICNKNEFEIKINFLDEDQQFSLNFLKNIITESKIDKTDVINKMAIKTLDYVFIAVKMDNLLLLCIYLYILRGWSKLSYDVNNQITKRIFEYDFDVDIFTLFKTEFHLLLFKLKLIDLELYQNHITNLLTQSSVINNIVLSLLKTILSSNNNFNDENNKILFKKISNGILNSHTCKCYYDLFNKKTSILIDMANNYNYLYKNEFNQNNMSSPENNISDVKDKKELNNLYLLFFMKITKLGVNLIFSSDNQNSAEENKIENIFSENDILNCTQQICEISLNNTFDNKFKKYSFIFYPEKLAIFTYYLITYKNISFMSILDIVINCFHKDYVNNGTNFNQKKYYKFFINLMNLISNPTFTSTNDININNTINNLILLCDTLKILSPKNYPGFILAWLDLISYHNFINNFLDTNLTKENSYKYEKYLSLLIEVLSYLNQIRAQIVKQYYFKYILDEIYKYFYLLVNTYPSFISAYSYLLVSCLSLSKNNEDGETNLFIQLKNIILSATIRDKNYLDNNYLNIKLLKENNIPGKIIYLINDSIEINETINKEDLQLKILINKFFNEKDDENILDEILEILDNIKEEKEINYIYNGLALYMVQNQVISQNNDNMDYKKVLYDFYMFLICNLNEVHKKHLIDSILNLLQYPCSFTIEFSSLFQDLLLNIGNENIEKQLLLNFLKRITCEPLPWGIIYTLKSINENDKFKNIKKLYFKGNEKMEDFLNKVFEQIKKNELKKNL